MHTFNRQLIAILSAVVLTASHSDAGGMSREIVDWLILGAARSAGREMRGSEGSASWFGIMAFFLVVWVVTRIFRRRKTPPVLAAPVAPSGSTLVPPAESAAPLPLPSLLAVPAIPVSAVAVGERGVTGVLIGGYTCAALSLAFLPPILGLAGIVCGVLVVKRQHTNKGLTLLVVSFVCAAVGMIAAEVILSP